jgi:hypothetical protein
MTCFAVSTVDQRTWSKKKLQPVLPTDTMIPRQARQNKREVPIKYPKSSHSVQPVMSLPPARTVEQLAAMYSVTRCGSVISLMNHLDLFGYLSHPAMTF